MVRWDSPGIGFSVAFGVVLFLASVVAIGGIVIVGSSIHLFALKRATAEKANEASCKASLKVMASEQRCLPYWRYDHEWHDRVEIEKSRRESCQNPAILAAVPVACRNIE